MRVADFAVIKVVKSLNVTGIIQVSPEFAQRVVDAGLSPPVCIGRKGIGSPDDARFIGLCSEQQMLDYLGHTSWRELDRLPKVMP